MLMIYTCCLLQTYLLLLTSISLKQDSKTWINTDSLLLFTWNKWNKYYSTSEFFKKGAETIY